MQRTWSPSLAFCVPSIGLAEIRQLLARHIYSCHTHLVSTEVLPFICTHTPLNITPHSILNCEWWMWAFLFLQEALCISIVQAMRKCRPLYLSLCGRSCQNATTRLLFECRNRKRMCVFVWQGPSARYFSSLPLMITSVSAVRRLCGRGRGESEGQKSSV